MKAKLPAGANSPIAINGEYLITAAGYPDRGRPRKPRSSRSKSAPRAQPVESVLAAGGDRRKRRKQIRRGWRKRRRRCRSRRSGASSELAAGEEMFDTNCSSCHTLAAAGTNGNVGPNLDKLEPSDSLVEKQVTNGGGGMPAFGSTPLEGRNQERSQIRVDLGGQKAHPGAGKAGGRKRLGGRSLRPAAGHKAHRASARGARCPPRRLGRTPVSLHRFIPGRRRSPSAVISP